MKLEIRENMYVRFKDKRGIKYIRKIVEIPQDNRYASLYLDKEANYSCGLSPKNVIKASYNIIDLVEEDDIVNGNRVIEVVESYIEVINIFGNHLTYSNEDIKSVITHEQMEQMSYKVGD